MQPIQPAVASRSTGRKTARTCPTAHQRQLTGIRILRGLATCATGMARLGPSTGTLLRRSRRRRSLRRRRQHHLHLDPSLASAAPPGTPRKKPWYERPVWWVAGAMLVVILIGARPVANRIRSPRPLHRARRAPARQRGIQTGPTRRLPATLRASMRLKPSPWTRSRTALRRRGRRSRSVTPQRLAPPRTGRS